MDEPTITILDWVLQLVEDPERMSDFGANGEEFIENDPDLQPRQKKVLKSRDHMRIHWVMVYESDLDPDALPMHGIFFMGLPPASS